MIILVLILFLLAKTAPVSAQNARPIIVDHTSLHLFDQIPEQYIQAAQNLRMFYIDRSVGGNISAGLDCLQHSSDEVAPSSCKRYQHHDSRYASPQSIVNWSRPGGYNRSNWHFYFEPGQNVTPEATCTLGTFPWYNFVACFEEFASAQQNNYDVMSFEYSYLSVADSSTDIASLQTGFFVNQANRKDIYDYQNWELSHPNKTVVYWTTSLARGIGTSVSQSFNDQMRQFARNNNKALLDVADILAHDPYGNPCYDNRDGVQYCTQNGNCENYPDDGLQIPAICQHYTTETDGGHLYSPAQISIAKGMWILMAQVAGWNPGASTTPTFRQLISNWLTSNFDRNGDSKVNALDFVTLIP